MMSNDDLVENETGGPHELREAQFMLAGKKEVAYFCFDYPKEYFQDMQKCIDEGLFETIKFGAEKNARLLASIPGAKERALALLGEGPYEHIVVYVPGAKAKALRLIELEECSWKYGYVESIEREIGQILGYSQESTDRYIEKLKQRFPGLPATIPAE
ncbi:hypothetical protein ACVFVO_18175 [Advenella kashmirensis]